MSVLPGRRMMDSFSRWAAKSLHNKGKKLLTSSSVRNYSSSNNCVRHGAWMETPTMIDMVPIFKHPGLG